MQGACELLHTHAAHSSNTAVAATCSHRLAAAHCLVTEGPPWLAQQAGCQAGIAGACRSRSCENQKLSVGVWLERLCGTMVWMCCLCAGAKQ